MKSINILLFRNLFICSVLVGLWSCESDNGLPNREYTLTWEDNFDGAFGSLPDSTKWNFDIGTGEAGWGNQELQYYRKDSSNVSLDGDGNLTIVARAEAFGGSSFTSGRINTKGLFEQVYGRFEARIKTPYGPGIWPAFWMLGADIDIVGWPQTGEIDIMELRGQEPSDVHGSLHGPGYSGGSPITSTFSLIDDRFDNDFHIFVIEWGEGFVDYFVDDRLYQRVTPADVPGEWVYDDPFFVILNLAVGGTYVGFPSPQTPFPQTMYIDYVRVYKEAN